jgi:hypothetical protein
MPRLDGTPNATTDRVSVSIRWVEKTWDECCELAREWGVSRNSMANILLKEALEARAFERERRDIDAAQTFEDAKRPGELVTH